jgi:hypothetical protein
MTMGQNDLDYMATVSRRDLLMLLVGLGPSESLNEGLGGITRLQKYLFLLENEEQVRPSGAGFEFVAYKAGPYSSKLYDDIEVLENLGLLESEVTADASFIEAAEVDELTFDQLLDEASPTGEEVAGPEAFEERRFRLSTEGEKHVRLLLAKKDVGALADSIRRVKSRYAGYSLSDLLYHVYTKYDDWTTESEIREKVLRKGRHR